jgi:hypothetical protein
LGRLYIFKGRSVAEWLALETLTDASTSAKYVAVDSADWVVNGSDAESQFGQGSLGITSLGDLDGDGKSEFTVGVGNESFNKLNIYKAGAPPTLLQAVTQPTVTAQGVFNAFGSVSLGGHNLLNGSANDLIATYQGYGNYRGAVFIYADLGASGAPVSPSLSIYGTNFFGTAVSAGNVNTGDTNEDLLIGTNASGNSSAYLLWNHGGTFRRQHHHG